MDTYLVAKDKDIIENCLDKQIVERDYIKKTEMESTITEERHTLAKLQDEKSWVDFYQVEFAFDRLLFKLGFEKENSPPIPYNPFKNYKQRVRESIDKFEIDLVNILTNSRTPRLIQEELYRRFGNLKKELGI